MKQNHIIDKVVIEVSVNSKEKAYEIKDSIGSFLAMNVFPKLEKYFNSVQDTLPQEILQISQLTISLDESRFSLNSTLQNAIIQSFEKELSKKIKLKLSSDNDATAGLAINILGKEEKLLNTFIHFIEKGYMPWWVSNEQSATILKAETFKKIILVKGFATKIVYSIEKSYVKERIINQFTNTQITQICQEVIKNKNLKIVLKNAAVEQLLKQFPENRKALWSLILNILTVSFSINNIEEHIIKEVIKTFPTLKGVKKDAIEELIWIHVMAVFPSIKQNNNLTTIRNKIKKIIETDRGNKNSNKEKEILVTNKEQTELHKHIQEENTDQTNSYHLQNAGLVLIHPFISNLFRHCNLFDQETKKLSDPEICIHLLHYIATGKTNQPECNMQFEKFLCNIPLSQTINRHIKLSCKHKSEAAKVIAAVKENWPSMKTASVELLQNEFFQRSGKLVLNDNPTLTIENKTQDILLNKLSWGIGFIKLPWQKEFIYVNW